MDLKDLETTSIWQLYEEAKNYANLMGIYTDTDRNFRMYNGNQMQGLKIKGIEPVQLNFIHTIVKFKVSSINQNLWGINFSSENFENADFRRTADKTCQLLNKRANKIWEKDGMDYKCRRISTNAAVNSECPIYVNWNNDTKMPENEILSKNDIYFGNENDSDIQSQPYILIKQRKSVIQIKDIAENEGIDKDKIEYIVGDKAVFEESGEDSKYEKDDMCTLITKLYKKNGKVYYAKSTRFVDLMKDKDSGLTLYPVTHMIWEDKEGSARGEGEVKNLIPNQLEVNKTLTRRALVAKNTAYPQKVVNISKIQNPDAINTVGGTIKLKDDKSVEDVRNVFYNTVPAQMSSDVQRLQQDLMEISRQLANASDSAVGDINPETASGRAIIAIQQASAVPLTEQRDSLKMTIEDLARIWLDMIIAYNQDGLSLEEEIEDPMTGEKAYQIVKITASILNELKASVKVDITPKSAFDKYAQELTLENLLKGGWFSPQMIGQLEIYVNALEDDSTMPKQKVLEIIRKEKEKQQRIAQMQTQAQMMIQQANNFLSQDVDSQAEQLSDAQMYQTVKAQVEQERANAMQEVPEQ